MYCFASKTERMGTMAITKRKHNGKTQYRVRIGYTDIFGTHKRYQSKWYDLRKEAVEDETNFRTDIKSYSVCSVTFEEVFRSWLTESEKKKKKKTTNDKRRLIEMYCPSQMMKKRISTITPAYIKKYILDTDEIHKLGTERKNKIYDNVNGVFKFAIIYFGLPANPMESIPRFKKSDKEVLKEFNVYTVQEFNEFYDLFPVQFKKYANFMYMLFWTGMRLNECRSLTFRAYDGRAINLKMQLDKDGSWTTLKWNSQRRIVLNPGCADIIESQRKEYSQAPGFNDDWFIFGGYRPFSCRTLERVKNDVIKNNGLKYIRIHDLRHSHASYLIEKGVNIYKISKRLGHSSISITLDRYGHLLDTEGDEILRAIS